MPALGKYRNELKGLAIIWIVLFHSDIQTGGITKLVIDYGYGGVDIFMLLSGFGLYCSLDKNSDLRGYLSRRASRLLPTYIPFCLLWLCVMLPYFGLSIAQSARVALGSLTMVGWLAGVPHITNWYVSLLLLSIILAPMAHALLSRSRKPYMTLGVMLIVSIAISACFWGNDRLMVYSRLPIFFIGMGLAMPRKKKPKPAWAVACGIATFLLGAALLLASSALTKSQPLYMSEIGLYWYPFILITPPLCLGLAWLFSKTGRLQKPLAPLRFLGSASFEIFLFNAWAEITAKPLGFYDNNLEKLLFSLLSVALGCAYHIVVAKIIKRAAKRRVLGQTISAEGVSGEN